MTNRLLAHDVARKLVKRVQKKYQRLLERKHGSNRMNAPKASIWSPADEAALASLREVLAANIDLWWQAEKARGERLCRRTVPQRVWTHKELGLALRKPRDIHHDTRRYARLGVVPTWDGDLMEMAQYELENRRAIKKAAWATKQEHQQ